MGLYEIEYRRIVDTVAELCVKANTQLPEDVRRAVERAAGREASPVGRGILTDVQANFRLAADKALPICQDTGMAVVFVDLGQETHIVGGGLAEAVNEGVAKGYVEGKLRCSVVADPLRRVNTGDNSPAVLHLTLRPGPGMTVTVAPKGFGSENMTALRMFTPAAGREEVLSFVVDSVASAGSNPCPPVVVGVGLGGTAEKAAELAKRALLLDLETPSADPFYAEMEAEALSRINALGIGPQGLGGSATALGVHILPYPTHIAGLPCAVSVGCHVNRHATAEL